MEAGRGRSAEMRREGQKGNVWSSGSGDSQERAQEGTEEGMQLGT